MYNMNNDPDMKPITNYKSQQGNRNNSNAPHRSFGATSSASSHLPCFDSPYDQNVSIRPSSYRGNTNNGRGRGRFRGNFMMPPPNQAFPPKHNLPHQHYQYQPPQQPSSSIRYNVDNYSGIRHRAPSYINNNNSSQPYPRFNNPQRARFTYRNPKLNMDSNSWTGPMRDSGFDAGPNFSVNQDNRSKWTSNKVGDDGAYSSWSQEEPPFNVNDYVLDAMTRNPWADLEREHFQQIEQKQT